MPHSVDTERIVLGSVLVSGEDLTACIDMLSDGLFYVQKHKDVLAAIWDLYTEEQEVDLLTVAERLKKLGKWEKVGGNTFLNTLTGYVSGAANIETHVRILMEYSVRREMIKVGYHIQKKGREQSTDAFEALEDCEKQLFEINEHYLKGDYVRLGHGINLGELQDLSHGKGVAGIQSGFRTLDRATGGWQPGNLIVLAARPGMGKTALALSILRNLAVDFDTPVGLFSMEMSMIELAHRWIALEVGLDHKLIRQGQLSDKQLEQIAAHSKALLSAPIYIDEEAALTITELRARARRMAAKENIKLLVVDYLQLMQGDAQRGHNSNREQEIANISRKLKGLSKELSLPIIAISQLSREVERRGGDRRPVLSDLRESGAIEQDADMVIFLYRPEYYDITQNEQGQSTAGLAELIIAKHRNGSTSTATLGFEGAFMRFKELDHKIVSSRINKDTSREDMPF